MNLHEYQAKELLKKFDLPLLKGKSYTYLLKSIEEDLLNLKGPPWVVKSQIHAGGRGAGYFKNPFNQKGGVQVLSEKKDVISISKSMLGNTLITKQTGPRGKKINRIFIEEGCDIERELYISLLIDRNTSQLMSIISGEGGMDIEDFAENHPEKLYKIYFNDVKNISLDTSLKEKLQISTVQFHHLENITKKLTKAFISLDASTIEINPLVITKDGDLLLLDAKITIDDNALFRHPELIELKDETEENPLELEAYSNGLSYVKLNGSIGCMVNGAGLAMATMDIIKQFGKEPANFLDLGGTANKDRVISGFKIFQNDENAKSIFINIFGGIVRCDIIANGIVEAINELKFNLPIVVRFQGTNADKGRDIINKSSLNLISIDDFTKAAKKVSELSR